MNEAMNIPNEIELQNEVMDYIGADVAEFSGVHVSEELCTAETQKLINEEEILHLREHVNADNALQSDVDYVSENGVHLNDI